MAWGFPCLAKMSETCISLDVKCNSHAQNLHTVYIYIYVNLLMVCKKARSKNTLCSHAFYCQGYFLLTSVIS